MTTTHGRALRAPASATAIQGLWRNRNDATGATPRIDRWHDSPRHVTQRAAMARSQAGPAARVAQHQPSSDQPRWKDNPACEGGEAWHDIPLFVTENQELRANGAAAEQQAQVACATLLGLLAQLPDLEGTEAAVQGVRQGLLQLQADLAVAADALQQAATAGQGVHEAHAALLDSCRALPTLCDAFVEQATIQARQAHAIDLVDERDLLLGLARNAFAAAVPLRTATRSRSVAPRRGRRGHKDRAHGVLDVGAVVTDAGGVMRGGAVGVADIATGALNSGGGPMSAVVTPLGGVLGGIGVVFGAIGLALGANAARRGHSAERRLARLEANGEIEDADVSSIATFAKDKKREKKWGGAIRVTTGAGAIVAGTLALVAVGMATMGIGALVPGVAVAGTGLTIVLGKHIHRKSKRKAFQTKLPGLHKRCSRQRVTNLPADRCARWWPTTAWRWPTGTTRSRFGSSALRWPRRWRNAWRRGAC